MKILKIGALWCPACLIVNKHLKKIAGYDLEIINYDYDMDEQIVKQYNIGTILPVIIVLDNSGQEIKRLTGEVSQKEIIDMIEDVENEIY